MGINEQTPKQHCRWKRQLNKDRWDCLVIATTKILNGNQPVITRRSQDPTDLLRQELGFGLKLSVWDEKVLEWGELRRHTWLRDQWPEFLGHVNLNKII